MKIGFIGFGKMAQAMCHGIVSSGIVTPQNIGYTDKITLNSPFSSYPLRELITESDILFLSVKPQNLSEITWPSTADQTGKHIISILAGKTLQTLQNQFGSIAITRVMPNTPAMVNKSMSAFCHNSHVTEKQKQTAESLLKSFGKILEVTEDALDIVTAISGSGPAFFYRIATYISKTSQEHGLSHHEAITLIAQTLIGTGHMLLESGKTPETLISDVSSPNGTTVAGLEKLENSPIATILEQTIEAAYNRSKTLSKEAL
jgi:pyrroline-5-carboxylate reductase